MSSVPKEKWGETVRLYQTGLTMKQVAQQLDTSLNAVTYVLRKTDTPRRTSSESQAIAFESKAASFSKRPGKKDPGLETLGAALYWAEGYKTPKAGGLDFANSDPEMAQAFIRFLRAFYVLDEKRLRAFVYCHSSQNERRLVSFWSKKLNIPKNQFTRSYVKKQGRLVRKKMEYGLVHIRYSDKKLLRDVLNLIECLKVRYARRW